MTKPPRLPVDSIEQLQRVLDTVLSRVGQLEAQVEDGRVRISELEAIVVLKDIRIAELEDEVARLKGLPPRPKFKGKPSGMEQATSKPIGKTGRQPGRGCKHDKLTVTSEVILKPEGVPTGSRFKGYEDVLVQDLTIKVAVIRYRRERWQTPSGERIVAAMPDGVLGGFGPELRRFIVAGHFQGQVTTERLTALLAGMGLEISKRQVVRLISHGLEALIAEDQEVLRTGLETARWITVDDTSSRHGTKDGFVTQLGDDRFTAFRTAESKSRRAFLSTLQAGCTSFVINDEALAYMRQYIKQAPLLAALAAHPQRRFTDEAAWQAHLKALGVETSLIGSSPFKIATEGALWGGICDQGLLKDTVIVSDGAGQFRVSTHALCWVHTERLVHKLQPTTPDQRRAVEVCRSLIWWLYRDLKTYQRAPDAKRARMLRARFDRLFTRSTGYILLDRLLRRLHRQKADLLRVLERPEIPLHTNGSENDIRTVVTKRKISGGTVSQSGKLARDVMLGLMKTCAKLNVSFYRFLGHRFAVEGAAHVPSLPALVRLATA